MKPFNGGLAIGAMFVLVLFLGLPASADERPDLYQDDGYRAPIGPPAPQIASEDEKKEREKAKKLAKREKPKPEFMGRPWALELLPVGVTESIFSLAPGAVKIDYDYIRRGYLTDVADREPGWAEKRKVLRSGPIKAELGDNARPRVTLQMPEDLGPRTADEDRLGTVQLDEKPATTGFAKVLVFPPDTLRRRAFDNWDRMGRLPGFSYLDNSVGDDAFQFEPGTGPFPRCQYNTAFERDRGLCPQVEAAEDSRYLVVEPGGFTGPVW